MDNTYCKNKIFNSKAFISLKPYLSSLFVVLLFSFPLFCFEYSTDTYHFALRSGLSGIYGAMKYNGRLIIYLATKALEAMSVSFVGYYYISYIMSIVFYTLAIATVYKMLRCHMEKRIAFFLAILTILNPMAFELFLFIEKGFFAFAIFMSVLACRYFLSFLQGKRWHIVFSYLFVALSCFTYQPMPGAFVALVLVFIVKYSKTVKNFIINTGLAVTVYGFATFMNFIVMKLFGMSGRMGSGLNFANIYKYLTFGLNIPYLLLVYVGIFAVLFAVVFISAKKKSGKAFTKESVLIFCQYSFIMVGTILTTAAPSIVTTPENVWFTLRYSYPIGMLVGTIPILFNFNCDYEEKEAVFFFEKSIRKSSIVILSVFLILMVVFHSFFFSRHITNSRDEADALKIGEIIEKYEKRTGIEVKYISLYRDSDCSIYFDGVVRLPNCNVRAITTEWCNIPHINLFNGRNFVRVNNSNKYKSYFESKNWDEISEEQFIFEGSTLHLGIY